MHIMTTHWNRRSFLAGVGAASLASIVTRDAQAASSAIVHEPRVISHLKHRYHGWPTLTRRANGELLVVCSGGRETHVCPFGRVELIRSKDEGKTWSWPEIVIDGPIDDRDAGIVETAKGSLLVTTFTSLAYEPTLAKAEKTGNWDAAKLARWQGAHHRIDAAQRKAALGVWMKRSTDGGVTWSGRYDSLVNSPHGPTQLSDGRLLYAGKELWREPHRIAVCESKDDGQTWNWLSDIPTRDGDNHEKYHELYAIEAADGRIIVQIRNHNAKNSGETLQCESSDGGKTWTQPRSIGVWGLPSHLLRLRDDRLVMTYGHRRAPLGNQARVSNDHGRTWSEPLVLSGDGATGDLGYPSTVQLSDGSMLTVWYELLKGSPFSQLRQVRWQLDG
jgi:sialidase-1